MLVHLESSQLQMVEEVRRLVKLKLHLPGSLPHTSPQVLHLYLLTTSQTTHCTSVYAERSPFGLPLEPFCHPLACFMISQGPPMWTASAYLAPSPSRIQPKESTCRSLAGRKTKMAGCVFPTSCLPACYCHGETHPCRPSAQLQPQPSARISTSRARW